MNNKTFLHYIKTGILVMPIIFSYTFIHSQNYQQKFDGIPFIIQGINSSAPFNGGIDVPRFQMLDIDSDNDLDIFIYDRDTNLYFYRNDGGHPQYFYKLITTKYQNLSIRSWFYFADIDNDNDADLFTGSIDQTIKFYRNIGSASNAVFSLQIDPLKTNTDSLVISEAICIPTFTDINNDGDLDFFSGNSSGTVSYYENIGNPQNFLFKFITNQFAGILIVGQDKINEGERHGASAITFHDVDSDNDKDLFWGDFFHPSIYFIRNTGSPQIFNWNFIDSTYPNNAPLFTQGFNMVQFYDMDADGDKDMITGVLFGSQTKDNFYYHSNIGPAADPQFTVVTSNLIKNPDVGSNSFPVFTDIDNDLDNDLFIGAGNSKISFYRNTGSVSSPSFLHVTDSIGVPSAGFNYAPAFGDIDGDNKKDMILGQFTFGRLRFYKNTGTLIDPQFTYQASQIDNIQVGQSSAPSLVDIDADGDLDLFVGNSGGKVFFYRNTGSANNFNFTLVSNNYANISAGNESNITFNDIDNDNDQDMLIGRFDGKIMFYRNDGTAVNPNHVFVTDNFSGIKVLTNSVPALVDIDNDTDKDLFVGNIKGGLFFYENRDVIGIKQINSEARNFRLEQNYPNPFNPGTIINFQLPHYSNVIIKIFDVNGRDVQTLVNEKLNAGEYKIEWDGSNHPSGLYFYKLETDGFSETKKMILIK